MKLRRILEHYHEEMNYEIMWDIMIYDKTNPQKMIIAQEKLDRYWGADPFLIKHEGIQYLFYERYDRKTKKGVIAYRIVNSDYSLGKTHIAIEEDYHLSFPFIFEHNGNLFIIPESSSANCIQIYKAERFPEKWSLYKVIASEFPAVDTIVLNNDYSKVVLHTSVGDSCSVENYILTLDSDFNLIDKKKIKDFSEYGNRNAGRLIFEEDKIIRVGQNCTNGDYGKGIVFYDAKIIEKETELQAMWLKDFCDSQRDKYCGIHTYNECDGKVAIDMKYLLKKSWINRASFLFKKSVRYLKRRLVQTQ